MKSKHFDQVCWVSKNVLSTNDRHTIENDIISGERWLEFFEMKISTLNEKRHKKSRKRYLNNYYRHRRIVREMRKRLNAL